MDGLSQSGEASPNGIFPVRPHRRLKRTLIAIAVTLSLIVAVGAGGLYLVYRKLDGNLHTRDLSAQLGKDRPTPSQVAQLDKGNGQPLNVLVMGSDSRACAGCSEYQATSADAQVTGARSDTTMLVHISGDRTRATVVSFPRDLWVTIPSCTLQNGNTTASHTAKFNEAFALGGPACTIKLVEKLSNVFVDHYVVVDFDGFKKMVNALGGVDVCLSKPVNDAKAGLVLPAGTTTVKGDQALAFVRARYGFPGGDDIGRIQRQQAFITSLVQKMKSSGTLLNLPKLYNVLNAATSSLTTDIGSLNDLRKLAQQMGNIPLDHITFLTAPWSPRGDGSVDLQKKPADSLFAALRADKPWAPAEGEQTAANSPSATPSVSSAPSGPTLTVDPSKIKVKVYNASGKAGAANTAAQALRAVGFNVTSVVTAPRGIVNHTVVSYAPAYDASGATLIAAIPGASWVVGKTSLGSTLEVYVGSDFPTVVKPTTGSNASATASPSASAPGASATPTTIAPITANTDICTASKRR